MAKPNPIARLLRTSRYRKRVVRDRTKYSRQRSKRELLREKITTQPHP